MTVTDEAGFRRTAAPSVETTTVEPRRAPMRSRSTIGSAAARPWASRRRPIRSWQPARVSCRRVEVRVPSMRARYMAQWILRAPLIVICRSRVKVMGVVTPSPVGVAMLKLR